MLARFIRTGIGGDFPRAVHDALYRQVKDGTSKLLKSLSRVCVPRRIGGVRAVVTYNFEDLLERQLEESGIAYRSIFRENDVPGEQELGVYHVHGFLPHQLHKEGVADSLLVFSEEGYHTVFMDPYSWSNLVQLTQLRERTCLFVGLSLTDPNLRRLADFAARRTSKVRHFILLRRSAQPSPAPDLANESLLHRVDTIHHGLEEIALRELGLNAIWLDSHGEIPEILDSIRIGISRHSHPGAR